MPRTVITLPVNFLRYLQVDWDIDWRQMSGGDFNDGTTGTMFFGFPRWIGTPTARLRRSMIGQWRAIRAEAQGALGVYRIRMQDPLVFDVSALDGVYSAQGIPTSTGATLANGLGTEYAPFAIATTQAMAGAVRLSIDTSSADGYTPVVGQIMSHGEDWPFLVSSVRDHGANVYELTVQMPLRAAVSSGDLIQLRGLGRFQALEPDMGRVSYGAAPRADVSLNFVEVPYR